MTIKEELALQLNRFATERQRLQRKVVAKHQLDVYGDFEELNNIRNSLFAIYTLIPNDLMPTDCKIKHDSYNNIQIIKK